MSVCQTCKSPEPHYPLRRAQPQSYAFDRYYFARSGQLFMILIGHVGDKEDWELYNYFLQNFQFDRNRHSLSK
jgi:hypothetical protein